MRGAEAIVTKEKFLSLPAVKKERAKKKYRNRKLDEKLRRERTRLEAKLISRAKKAGVLCPVIYSLEEYAITMSFIEGEMLHEILKKDGKIPPKELKKAGKILNSLHTQNIIHGDFTPANLILSRRGLSTIDFGLGYFSRDIEDFAVDVLTMKKALGKKQAGHFLSAYGNSEVLAHLKEVEKRGRYVSERQ